MNDCNAKRVVVLVDMDCFYCQVEVQHDPSLAGLPVAVVQYNSWRGGGIIAVNYEARAKGVGRHMRGNDAVKVCPDLNLVRVKEMHGKADLSKYRTASNKVFEVLSEFSSCVQRASIDEAYVDLTNLVNDHILSNPNIITETDLANTFIEGYSDKSSKENRSESMKSWLHDVYNNELNDDHLLRLTVGAMMVEKLRESIFKKTGFRCSAGIANNKILAKLVCGLHKPNQQTLLPPSSIPSLFKKTPVKKVRNLGGKLGNRVKKEFNCEFMSDLAEIPLSNLRQKFDEKTSNFLYQISRGIDNEPVESRLISKSIGSCKSFPLGLKTKEEVQHWLSTLINDIVEKLEADYETNKRKATLMTVSVRYKKKDTHLPTSQCGEVTTYNKDKLLDTAYSMLCTMTENQKSQKNWKNPLLNLGVAVGKFKGINEKSSIDNYFNKGTVKEEKDIDIHSINQENETITIKNLPGSSSTSGSEQLNLENRKLSTNEPTTSFHHSNNKKDASTNEVRNIKTMFAQMKNASTSSIDIVTTQHSSSTKDKKNTKQNKMNSFFSKKLEIITSPIKTEITDKLTTGVHSPSMNLEGFFSKKVDNNTPTKNVQNENIEKISVPPSSFFSRKLEIVSPSKQNTDSDPIPTAITSMFSSEESVEEAPKMLLCERCKKTIDIDQYDEHIDHHVAMELSKSLNATDITHSLGSTIHKTGSMKKKKNGFGKKRKHNSNASSSSPKKQCTSISSYFKPVLNP